MPPEPLEIPFEIFKAFERVAQEADKFMDEYPKTTRFVRDSRGLDEALQNLHTLVDDE